MLALARRNDFYYQVMCTLPPSSTRYPCPEPPGSCRFASRTNCWFEWKSVWHHFLSSHSVVSVFLGVGLGVAEDHARGLRSRLCQSRVGLGGVGWWWVMSFFLRFGEKVCLHTLKRGWMVTRFFETVIKSWCTSPRRVMAGVGELCAARLGLGFGCTLQH